MLAAWARRNSRQPGPDLRGAGPSPARASRRRIVDGDTPKPSLASSPPIRRWPQRGFSRASRSTRARTSDGAGGRPRWPGGCRHFLRTSPRCQRNSVRGLTRRAERKERGRWQAAAASRARSVARSLGRATSRRSTSSSWRTTRSSMSLTSRPRDCGRAPPAEPETRGRGRRRPHRRSSQPSPRRGATRLLTPFKSVPSAACRSSAAQPGTS
jgi:hypothetical protein